MDQKKSLAIELVTKEPYMASGPRGIDVYAVNLARSLKRLGVQVLHSSGTHSSRTDLTHYTFFDPFFPTLISSRSHPTVVTVHDLIPLVFPQHFHSGIRGKFRWLQQRNNLRQVQAIITDSVCSQRDIARLTGISPLQIHVVPLAPPVREHSLAKAQVISHYHLPAKYLLYLGDINWNKNIPGLIKAFGHINDPEIYLVLAGKAFVNDKNIPELAAIQAALATCPNRSRIITPGFVDDNAIKGLFQGSVAFIQPSWYEGYGFSVIEALSYGCPVISSNSGSLTEVGDQFVHYFDPAKVTNLANLLNDLLSHPSVLNQFTAPGRQYASKYTWSRTATLTKEIYEKITTFN